MTAGPAPDLLLDPIELSDRLWMRSRFELAESAYVARIESGGLRRLWGEQLSLGSDTRVGVDDLEGEVLITRRNDAGEVVLLQHDDGTLSLLDLTRGSAAIEVAGTDARAVEARRDRLALHLGATEPAPDEVPVTFWATGPTGPRSARRLIKAPAWCEVERNYATPTNAALEPIVTAAVDDIPEGGRLLLWHGLPGTGKTTALRALARQWASWCSTHFVTDPEGFLGANTSYLLDVLASEGPARDRQARGWKLIVLEDSGELLTADAHERTGQALSRLINITDGLIGQGMRVIVLVTTNEPLGRLHPAVQRPGRCWAEIEFHPLSAKQASEWLAAHGHNEASSSPACLADLYARLRGEPVAESRAAVGFVGR